MDDVPPGTWRLHAWHERFGRMDTTVTVTAAATAPEWTRTVNPEWDFLTVVRDSGMVFTQDWEADLEAAGVDLAHRIGHIQHLALKDYGSVRAFFIKYQDNQM